MDPEGWSRPLDAYCERTGPEFWSEPANALTNAAFLIAAVVMARRTRGALPMANVLIALLAAIGVGSFLFHTFATPWAALADTTPIGLFVLAYVFAANRWFWGLGPWAAAIGTALFVPYAAVAGAGFARLPFFAVSAAYWPIALLIALYGLALLGRAPATGRGLLTGAGVLALSLVARSVDGAVCDAFPLGTHLAWHLLNALMLGWMIEVYHRHVEAGRSRSHRARAGDGPAPDGDGPARPPLRSRMGPG